jgi:UDP-2-acetamido-2,6-beta-L-arabino-hexul-4-ose reductase
MEQKMKILVTGSKGFVGKNLIAELNNKGFKNIYKFDMGTKITLLCDYAKDCEFVFHLAGVNRPEDEKEYMRGNFEFTSELLVLLKKNNNQAPILFTSSVQAGENNPYGRSKKAAEDLLFSYNKETGANVFIYRLPNLFGKWCRPNYNSVVATFCHNIANELEIKINDPGAELILSYIDDVLAEFLSVVNGKVPGRNKFLYISKTHKITLGELAEMLYLFRKSRETLIMPSLKSGFALNLYGTYLSYLPENNFSYKLKKNEDNRGWLAEFIKSESMGQMFVSRTKPGITRGNHWHNTKVEKFLVIEGEAIIKFRKIGSRKTICYKVNGETPEVVDVPAGYTHSITNTGKNEMVTLFWASGLFNIDNPDTYHLEV